MPPSRCAPRRQRQTGTISRSAGWAGSAHMGTAQGCSREHKAALCHACSPCTRTRAPHAGVRGDGWPVRGRHRDALKEGEGQSRREGHPGLPCPGCARQHTRAHTARPGCGSVQGKEGDPLCPCALRHAPRRARARSLVPPRLVQALTLAPLMCAAHRPHLTHRMHVHRMRRPLPAPPAPCAHAAPAGGAGPRGDGHQHASHVRNVGSHIRNVAFLIPTPHPGPQPLTLTQSLNLTPNPRPRSPSPWSWALG